jgi:hypothetical protein
MMALHAGLGIPDSTIMALSYIGMLMEATCTSHNHIEYFQKKV